MQVGSLVREITMLNRKPSLGILLEVGSYNYFIYWFDDSTQSWARPQFFELVQR